MDEDDYEDLIRWREGMDEPEDDSLAESEQEEEDDDVEKIANDFLKGHPVERKGREKINKGAKNVRR